MEDTPLADSMPGIFNNGPEITLPSPVKEEPFNPAAIAKAKADEEAQKAGYRASEFKWFGTDVPTHLAAKCMMCDYSFDVKREIITKKFVVPENCPECRRKALIIYDGGYWVKYASLKLWEFDFFADQFDELFAARTKEDRVCRVFPIRSEQFRQELALTLKNRAQIDQTMLYLEGLARRGGNKRPLEIRVAAAQGAIWIDLCDDQWRAVRLDKNGWEIIQNPPVLFKRYKHMLPMELDKTGTKEDFEAFLALMNFQTREDKMLYSGFLVQGFVPNIDRPILMPTGPQGSAKTTMCIATRMVIDPSALPTFNMNREEEELPQKVLKHYLPTFDNCNHISQEISDMLCQASSGMGFSKRKLFTDLDDVAYTVRRALVLNGVAAPSMAPDLLDRTILICLERITDENRKERAEVEAMRDALLPKVRGYLLNILVAALANPVERNGALPRLADFARIAESCAVQMGYEKGQFIQTYQAANRENAEQAVQSDPLAAVLLGFLGETGEPRDWTGAPSDLFKEMTGRADSGTQKSHLWPKSASWMSEALVGRLKPGLRLLGWNVQKVRSGTKRSISITKVGDGLKGW